MNKSAAVVPPPYLLEKGRIVDSYLEQALPSTKDYPQILHEAIRYSVMAGGKRLRPVLAITSYEACGGRENIIMPAAAALELIHTYSLIHDDLPCMDDDELRRGQPTLHKKYNEAVALLAGDALHDLAFNLMAQTGVCRAVLELALAIGTGGMLAGQVADMEAEGRRMDVEGVRFIHEHKTGKLIRGSVRIGAILAGADENALKAVTEYGEKTGLAFQIIDDILDIIGDEKTLGKPVGSDTKNEKATYPGVIGLEQSRSVANRLIDEAVRAIEVGVEKSENFIGIARFIGSRSH